MDFWVCKAKTRMVGPCTEFLKSFPTVVDSQYESPRGLNDGDRALKPKFIVTVIL